MNLSKYAPKGATHALLLGGVQGAGGIYSLHMQWVKDAGGQLYVYTTDEENEYPEWVKAERTCKNIPVLRSAITPI